ncbi:DNA-binding PadR family transcriptional regulator [Thermocatellispora tengchongensis]|uniref:DNA-binding PadR family transcriptional regulator n=1 Tax=Thermocatellispora tengchongensis TaxID=1073253 RepID=A0A840NV75_9ACTN|nr:PadR family transcriptional regulator [Thermocatellispora tengchongensis]MBB5130709.1 DNA-binding PadR family transcriptional regulator [Thermocatellispora tengchongensis]
MARRRSGPDLVGLTVLALLSVRPSHPYELHRFIIDTHKEYVRGLPRSLYHAVDRLAAEELIEPAETSREGRRPERTVYRITAEGRAELATRLTRLLEQPGDDSGAFVAAISLIGCLPVPAAERALRGRAAALHGRVAALDAHMRALEENGLPRVLALELECERALRAAEAEWVGTVLARLGSGELTWPASLKSGLLASLAEEENPAPD